TDFSCPCGAVLGAALREHQVWDVAVACPACGVVSTWPSLPAGQATGRAMFLDVGRYRLASPVALPPSASMVGPAALVVKATEPGRGIFARTDEAEQTRAADANELRKMASKARELFAATYTEMEAAQRKG